MKILLIAVNAKYIHSNLAVASLRAYAQAREREADTVIEVAEYTINQPEDEILADLYQRNPDAAAFSCYIWNWEMVWRLAGNLNRIRPGLPIWLGGPEVSFETMRTMEEMPFVSGILAGEGERIFDGLVRFYEGKGGLTEIPGLTFRLGEEIICRPPAEPMDLNEVPFAGKAFLEEKNRILYYESSRGCPFRCSYCLSSVDKKLRFRDTERVQEELSLFLEAKVPQVKFVDRTFNCNKEHARKIWRFLQENDNGVTNFHFEIAADLLEEADLAILKQMRPGQIQLEIGVQSTNPQTLREIERYADWERLKENVDAIRSFGNIHQHLDLIAGLPFEDYASFGRSFNAVYERRPDQLQLGFLKVLKGSRMYEKQADYGLLVKKEPPYEVLGTRWLSYEDVVRLKGVEEMVERYYNSGQFRTVMDWLAEGFSSPFSLYEALARYSQAHALPGQNFSRTARYERLLAFAEEVRPGEAEEARALLTFDLYLREPVKSRPSFAGDRSAYRKAISDRTAALWEQERAKGLCAMPYRQFLHETHMEVFVRDPENPAEKGEFWYWFDYRKRDPLNRNARVYRLSGDGEAEKTFQKR